MYVSLTAGEAIDLGMAFHHAAAGADVYAPEVFEAEVVLAAGRIYQAVFAGDHEDADDAIYQYVLVAKRRAAVNAAAAAGEDARLPGAGAAALVRAIATYWEATPDDHASYASSGPNDDGVWAFGSRGVELRLETMTLFVNDTLIEKEILVGEWAKGPYEALSALLVRKGRKPLTVREMPPADSRIRYGCGDSTIGW